MQSEKSSYYCC